MSDNEDVEMDQAGVVAEIPEPPSRLIPWIEKYRPASVDEVAHQPEAVAALRKCIETQNMPHLLFYGPAGSGKTSAAVALCRQLFGSEYRKRVLELNASDERGIAVVREKVKSFAQFAVSSSAALPPFKVIILDEADSMTKDAQAALRRTMEQFTKVTRFILICNYVSRIIEPVTSRCAKFRFQAVALDAQVERLSMIAKNENVAISRDTLFTLTQAAEGDMRRSVSLLQSLSLISDESEISNELVLALAGRVPGSIVDNALHTLKTAKSLEHVFAFVDALRCSGFGVTVFANQLMDLIVADASISDLKLAKAVNVFALLDERLNDGADEELQISWALGALRAVLAA